MEIIKLNNENFEKEVIQSNQTVLVDFYADWCGPCKMMSPILDNIAKKMDDKIKIVKINVDESRDIATKYEIMSIPTLIIFKNGKVDNKLVGLRDENEIISNL